MQLFRELNHSPGIGQALRFMADLVRSSDLDSAMKFLEEAQSIYLKLDDLLGRATTLKSLGEACQQQEKYEMAREHFSQAYRIARQCKGSSELDECCILTNLIEVHVHLAEYDLASSLLEKAVKQAQDIGYAQGEGNLYFAWSELLMCQREWDQAEEKCDLALELFRKREDEESEARVESQITLIRQDRMAALEFTEPIGHMDEFSSGEDIECSLIESPNWGPSYPSADPPTMPK